MKVHFNQETTNHDLQAWMEDLLSRMELRTMMDHEVIGHDGMEHAKAVGAGA